MQVTKILRFHVVTMTTLLLFLTTFSKSVCGEPVLDLDEDLDSDSDSEEVVRLSQLKFNPGNIKGVEDSDSEKPAFEKSAMAQLMKNTVMKNLDGKRTIPSQDKSNSTKTLLRQKEMLKKFKPQSESETKSQDSSHVRNDNGAFFDMFWWCAHSYYNSPDDCSCNHECSQYSECYGYDPPMMCPLCDYCVAYCLCEADYYYGLTCYN